VVVWGGRGGYPGDGGAFTTQKKKKEKKRNGVAACRLATARSGHGKTTRLFLPSPPRTSLREQKSWGFEKLPGGEGVSNGRDENNITRAFPQNRAGEEPGHPTRNLKKKVKYAIQVVKKRMVVNRPCGKRSLKKSKETQDLMEKKEG